jgi:hypothetical protein
MNRFEGLDDGPLEKYSLSRRSFVRLTAFDIIVAQFEEATGESLHDLVTQLVTDGRLRKLEIARVDGRPVHESPPWPAWLEEAGLHAGYRGFTFRG